MRRMKKIGKIRKTRKESGCPKRDYADEKKAG